MQQVEMFKGTDHRKQNPQNWLLKLEGAKFRYDTPDEQHLYTFSKHLKYGSKAHIWWRDELTIPNKASWVALKAAFHVKWPPITRAQPTMEEKQVKLFELKLTEDEVGTKVGDDKDNQVYSHVDWAQKVLAIAEDIEDDKGMLILIARNNLPLSIRTLLPNDISTWEKFTEGVSNISISCLTDEVDRDRSLRATTNAVANLTISQLTPRFTPYTHTPYRTPYQRTQPMPAEPQEQPTPRQPTQPTTPVPLPTTPNNCTNAPTDTYGRTTAQATINTPHFPAAPGSPLANRGGRYTKLAQQAVEDNIPYPDTDEGRQNYQAAITIWTQKYGSSQPDWSTGHFLLMPGSSRLGSNECYGCDKIGHRSDECGTPKHILDIEARWQSRINGLVRRRTHFIESPGGVPVFKIDAANIQIDPDVYDTTGLEFTDYEEAGNGQGLVNDGQASRDPQFTIVGAIGLHFHTTCNDPSHRHCLDYCS
jgi:hypothetical protein